MPPKSLFLKALAIAAIAAPTPASAIPYFARKYGVDCSHCHYLPPRLNDVGENFRNSGYILSGAAQPNSTFPFAVWASLRSDALLDEPETSNAVRRYLNRIEIISGGQIVAPWLSYFVEWRPLSLETQRRNGTVQLRDRSGRFEDLFATVSAGGLTATIGQFRLIDQTDVSLRLSLSEPLLLSASLADPSANPSPPTFSARRKASLRGFSPAGRSPAIRVGWKAPISNGWSWTNTMALAFPGEVSIPLTDEARDEASLELNSAPKGIVMESFLRKGATSYGGHLFYDSGNRWLANLVTTGGRGSAYWSGIVGLEHAASGTRGRWALEGEYFPTPAMGLGARIENRVGDNQSPGFLPYFSTHFPGTSQTIRLTLEQRFLKGQNTTLVELGWLF